MTVAIRIGPDVIRSYKRLAYTPWHALAEFVDNSTQSYFNNRDELDRAYKAAGDKLEVRIVYDAQAGTLRISDNAMGMSLDELTSALEVGRAPANTSGRSQFGLGLKTAACWLGNYWTIRTKKLGETTEHEIVFDVERVANNELEPPHNTVQKDKNLHYTVVEIRDLNTRLQGRRLGKIKQFLRSMYRVDIREGVLDLYWMDDRLEWTDETGFLKAQDGTTYKKSFSFVTATKTIDGKTIGGKTVSGWVGVLDAGSRALAGFSMLRRGRVVRGHPDAWRPESIFGQYQGSNDLINQRLVGEVSFDEFEVSHTKDDILWRENEQDEVEAKLKEIALDFMKVARERRKGKGEQRGPSETEIQAAVDELKTEMASKEFVDLVEIESVPAPEAVAQANKPVLQAAQREEPRFNAKIGHVTCRVYLSSDSSPNDPYFATDVTQGILVVVNTQHPHWAQIVGSEGVLNYLRHCVYDAIAEWQCWNKQAPVRPDTIKALKDALLRLPTAIEQAGDATSREDAGAAGSGEKA